MAYLYYGILLLSKKKQTPDTKQPHGQISKILCFVKEILHKMACAVSFDLYEVQREVRLMWDGKISEMLLPLLKDKIGKEHKELSGVVTMLIRVFVT